MPQIRWPPRPGGSKATLREAKHLPATKSAAGSPSSSLPFRLCSQCNTSCLSTWAFCDNCGCKLPPALAAETLSPLPTIAPSSSSERERVSESIVAIYKEGSGQPQSRSKLKRKSSNGGAQKRSKPSLAVKLLQSNSNNRADENCLESSSKSLQVTSGVDAKLDSSFPDVPETPGVPEFQSDVPISSSACSVSLPDIHTISADRVSSPLLTDRLEGEIEPEREKQKSSDSHKAKEKTPSPAKGHNAWFWRPAGVSTSSQNTAAALSSAADSDYGPTTEDEEIQFDWKERGERILQAFERKEEIEAEESKRDLKGEAGACKETETRGDTLSQEQPKAKHSQQDATSLSPVKSPAKLVGGSAFSSAQSIMPQAKRKDVISADRLLEGVQKASKASLLARPSPSPRHKETEQRGELHVVREAADLMLDLEEEDVRDDAEGPREDKDIEMPVESVQQHKQKKTRRRRQRRNDEGLNAPIKAMGLFWGQSNASTMINLKARIALVRAEWSTECATRNALQELLAKATLDREVESLAVDGTLFASPLPSSPSVSSSSFQSLEKKLAITVAKMDKLEIMEAEVIAQLEALQQVEADKEAERLHEIATAKLRMETALKRRAVRVLQRNIRTFLSRQKLLALIMERYRKVYHPLSEDFYYLDTREMVTSWRLPLIYQMYCRNLLLKGQIAVFLPALPTLSEEEACALFAKVKAPSKWKPRYGGDGTPYAVHFAATRVQQWYRRSRAQWLLCKVACVYVDKHILYVREKKRDVAATRIQAQIRGFLARIEFQAMLSEAYVRVKVDGSEEGKDSYFYFHRGRKESMWDAPKVDLKYLDSIPVVTAGGRLPLTREECATKIQAVFRRKRAMREYHSNLSQVYEKVLDPGTMTYFYYNRVTGQSKWKPPPRAVLRALESAPSFAAEAPQQRQNEAMATEEEQPISQLGQDTSLLTAPQEEQILSTTYLEPMSSQQAALYQEQDQVHMALNAVTTIQDGQDERVRSVEQMTHNYSTPRLEQEQYQEQPSVLFDQVAHSQTAVMEQDQSFAPLEQATPQQRALPQEQELSDKGQEQGHKPVPQYVAAIDTSLYKGAITPLEPAENGLDTVLSSSPFFITAGGDSHNQEPFVGSSEVAHNTLSDSDRTSEPMSIKEEEARTPQNREQTVLAVVIKEADARQNREQTVLGVVTPCEVDHSFQHVITRSAISGPLSEGISRSAAGDVSHLADWGSSSIPKADKPSLYEGDKADGFAFPSDNLLLETDSTRPDDTTEHPNALREKTVKVMGQSVVASATAVATAIAVVSGDTVARISMKERDSAPREISVHTVPANEETEPAAVMVAASSGLVQDAPQQAVKPMLSVDAAAVTIQCWFRQRVARRRLAKLLRQTYRKIYDPEVQAYFYHNVTTNVSVWSLPGRLAQWLAEEEEESGNDILETEVEPRKPLEPEEAAIKIQCWARQHMALTRARATIKESYIKVVDSESGMPFYHNRKTRYSTWFKPLALGLTDDLPVSSFASDPQLVRAMTPLSRPPTSQSRGRISAKSLTRAGTAQSRTSLHSTSSSKISSQPVFKEDLQVVGESTVIMTFKADCSASSGKRIQRVLSPSEAALMIQCWWRQRLAVLAAQRLLRDVCERALDPDSEMYYYYNHLTGTSSWIKPRLWGPDDDDGGFASHDKGLPFFEGAEPETATSSESNLQQNQQIPSAESLRSRTSHSSRRPTTSRATPPSTPPPLAAGRTQSPPVRVTTGRSVHTTKSSRSSTPLRTQSLRPATSLSAYSASSHRSASTLPPRAPAAQITTMTKHQAEANQTDTPFPTETVPEQREAQESLPTLVSHLPDASANPEDSIPEIFSRTYANQTPAQANVPLSLVEFEKKIVTIQKLWRGRHVRKKVLLPQLRVVYTKHWDEGSGLYYYYNSVTQVSSWSKPVLFGSHDVEETPRESSPI